jgi:hypothetical protein
MPGTSYVQLTYINLSSDYTLPKPTGFFGDGTRLTWVFSQASPGGFILTLDSDFILPRGLTISNSTQAGAIDVLAAMYVAPLNQWFVISFITGY